MPDYRSALGPFGSQVYSVTTSAKRPKMFSTHPMSAISVNKKGEVLYQDKKGYENAYRKHENSSATGDIRLMKNGTNKLLTTFKGNDQNRYGSMIIILHISARKTVHSMYIRAILREAKSASLLHLSNIPCARFQHLTTGCWHSVGMVRYTHLSPAKNLRKSMCRL